MVSRLHIFIDVRHINIELLISVAETTSDIVGLIVKPIIWKCAGRIDGLSVISGTLFHWRCDMAITGSHAERWCDPIFSTHAYRVGRLIIIVDIIIYVAIFIRITKRPCLLSDWSLGIGIRIIPVIVIPGIVISQP